MGKRIVSRRRGKGGNYRAPSHRYKVRIKLPDEKFATVTELMNDPARTAPLAKIKYESGKGGFVLASEGLTVGQKLSIGADADVKTGNVLPLSRIPDGTLIHNIEIIPNGGGKLVRSAGTEALVVSHEGGVTTVQLPSGRFKQLSEKCSATIGTVAGSGRTEKPIAKAGTMYYMVRRKAKVWPVVRKVAMNPVYHPHGGGSKQHIGGPGESPRDAPPGQKVGAIAPKRRGRLK